jgi:hypothetical protein
MRCFATLVKASCIKKFLVQRLLSHIVRGACVDYVSFELEQRRLNTSLFELFAYIVGAFLERVASMQSQSSLKKPEKYLAL